MTTSAQNHLIRPSSHVPWDVQVTGSIPESLMDEFQISQLNAAAPQGALDGTWACLLLGTRIHLWNTNADSSSGSGGGSGGTQKTYLLFHPDLKNKDVRLAMHATTTSSDTVTVYAAARSSLKAQTKLIVWLVRKGQRVTAIGQSPSCRSYVEADDITAMQAMEGGLLLGTATNNVYWGHLTPKPMSLTIQKLTKSNTSGILGYVFGTPAVEDPVQALFIIDKTAVLAITTTGHVERYTVSRKSGQLSSEHAEVGSLGALLQERHKIQVLRSVATKDQIHAIYLADNKVYYIHATINDKGSCLTLNISEWLCRFHVTVQCVGLVATENDMLYAVMSYPNESVSCLALNKSMEVDLPTKQVPSVVLLGKDAVTHGCHMVTSTGLLVRARWMQLQNHNIPTAAHSNPVLASHLSATFWHSYRSATGGMPIPPSLQSAKPADLERAILVVAQQIQQEGDSSSLKNPMEWHTSFIEFLKQNGLYRSVSNQGRWNLLGIGQELAVYGALGRNQHPLVKDLLPHGVATKLQLLQQHVLQFTSTEERNFCDALCLAVETAQQYRADLAVDTYDVLLDGHPCQLWTHQAILQHVFVSQLEYWRDSGSKLDPTQVTVVAKATLTSFFESSHKQYEQIKALAIPLVRAVDDDYSAFDLSQEYRWFEGLCQLSLDHRKEDYFQIDTLLREWDDSFGKFVLQWDIDRHKYGQLLRHGEHTPTLLTEFLERDDRLRPYRWIHSGRMNKYSTATSQLIDDAANGTINLHDTKWALSMAVLSNKASDHPDKRQAIIEAKLDLVKAQELLLLHDNGPLRTPEQLMTLAMDQLKGSKTLEESIQLCMVGLSIAKGEENSNAKASLVWRNAIDKDWVDWEKWITTSVDLTAATLRDTILDSTVFGGLWKAMQESSLEYHSVQYDTPSERSVLEALGLDAVGQTELKRLLRSITSIQLVTRSTRRSKSLIMSTYEN